MTVPSSLSQQDTRDGPLGFPANVVQLSLISAVL